MYDDNKTNEIAKHLANRLGKTVSRWAVKAGKKVAYHLGKMIIGFLIKTAPIWGPFVLVLLLVYGAYMAVYAIPRSAVEDRLATDIDKVGAFYGFSESRSYFEENKGLFERYQKIAEQWDDGLTESQRDQVEMHGFSWAILLAVDRLIHDPTITGEREIKINPQKVYSDLKPQFQWKDSTITTTRVVCTKDKDGNTVKDTETTQETVSLINQADTVEGQFLYQYKTITTKNGSGCGSTTVQHEEVENIQTPIVYYQPLLNYLKDKGIEKEMDVELVLELARIYDPQYGMNFSLVQGFDYMNYPEFDGIIGMNGLRWPTVSIRLTSKFGHRTNPKPSFHYGVDIGSVTPQVSGDPVYAMESGLVTDSLNTCSEGNHSCGGRYGNRIYIDHGNEIQSRYAHLLVSYVNVGEYVEKGTMIGRMGNTGDSYGAHLHFEIRQKGVPLNPMYYFTQAIEMQEERVDGTYAYAGIYEITAYTAGFESTGKNPGDVGYGRTASGTMVHDNRTIATDWSELPKGALVKIDGLSPAFVVEDKGGDIKGKRIDIFMSNLAQANQWGRQKREVWVKKK